MGSKKRKASLFALTNLNNEILMQLRDSNPAVFPNTWCIPGGTLSEGESYENNLMREAEEEFGIKLDIKNCNLLTTLKNSYLENANVYVCKLGYNVKPELREGADMKWMKIDEIKKLELAFGQNEFLPKLEDFLKTLQ